MMADWGRFKRGKARLRTWSIDKGTGKRVVAYKGIGDIRGERAAELRRLRTTRLHMSQSELAKAIRVSTRTLQGWESGRSLPAEPIVVLVRLMGDMPAVRSRLAHA
jgi:DNA-binding XRE family transcriptional regulator